MEDALQISAWGVALAYLLLLFPAGLMLLWGMPLLGRSVLAVVRMTVQLLLVGFYLQFVFDLNSAWLNVAWLGVMVLVADASILRGSGLRLWRFAGPMFLGLVVGTVIPLLVMLLLVIRPEQWYDARFFIPIGGMILGNCMRANIVGTRTFYEALRDDEPRYLTTLGQGATLTEATRPFMRKAGEAALAPTIATIATIGLVSLPGMMTGVILGGADPMTAILYQIAIMLAIFAGTALTVGLVILLTRRSSFNEAGILDRSIFTR